MTKAELLDLLREAREEIVDLWRERECATHLKADCCICLHQLTALDRIDAALAESRRSTTPVVEGHFVLGSVRAEDAKGWCRFCGPLTEDRVEPLGNMAGCNVCGTLNVTGPKAQRMLQKLAEYQRRGRAE